MVKPKSESKPRGFAKKIVNIISEFKGFKNFDDEKGTINRKIVAAGGCPQNQLAVARRDGKYVCKKPLTPLTTAQKQARSEKIKLGRMSCGINRKLRKKDEMCLTKTFKPAKNAPKYGKEKDIRNVMKGRISSALESLKKANKDLPSNAPKWQPVYIKRIVKAKDEKGNMITKTISFPLLSRSVFARSKQKAVAKKAPHLGSIVGIRIGKPEALFSPKKAQNRKRNIAFFKSKDNLPFLGRLVLQKAQNDVKGKGKGEKKPFIKQKLVAFSQVVADEKKMRTGVKIGMKKDAIDKKITSNIKDKLLKQGLIKK